MLALASPAFAQEVQSEPTGSAQIQILEDADYIADKWVVLDRTDKLRTAISLRLGTENRIPLETTKSILQQDFAKHGIENVAVFFEQGIVPATSVAVHTDEYVFGPYALINVRQEISKIAEQIKFNATFDPLKTTN